MGLNHRDYTEDKLIEQPAIQLFQQLHYKTADLMNEHCGPDNPYGRETRQEVVLIKRLESKLHELNPHIKPQVIQDAITELTRDRSSLSLVGANHEIYKLLKEGVKIKTQNSKGEEIIENVKVIDWNTPKNNNFLLVSQFWVSGDIYTRRSDLVAFINGLPLVFIELKAAHRNLKKAHDDNLRDYKETIPQLFWYNAFIILSNGRRSKIGTITAPWEHFNEWKRATYEEEEPTVSLEIIIRGTCEKTKLLDIIENFTLFVETDGKPIKILAKNHQYLGTNRAIQSFLQRKENEGKLGVFWHTTGSGKSYSMIFLTQKILRKIPGNYTFLIVTDRIDLDDQIYKNFHKTGAVTEPEDYIRADSREDLQRLLKEDHRHVFTLIHKFGTDKGQVYPKLNDRDDIIVICDEAHRTQYGTLALNMRTALPNASFIAFTATPLMEEEQRTREVFGEYVSIYNFQQSVQDGATVPLYYENRKPELEVINLNLNEDMKRLMLEAELDEDQMEKIEKQYGNDYDLITRDSRLEQIAQDIVKHYMGRGYRGKAMVISIDRYTAVKMYDKVQRHWKQHITELERKLEKAPEYEKEGIQKDIDHMKETDMAVIISGSQNEVESFRKKGLDIIPHRRRLNSAEPLDQKFKAPDDTLRIVFVCAMWMTGFDAPPVSTMYIDKPLRNHTLMQTISRANRVHGQKKSGTIVDYYGIFRNLNEALAIYGSATAGALREGERPIQDKALLIQNLEEALAAMKAYFQSRGINPEEILEAQGLLKVQFIDQAVDTIMSGDESRAAFFALIERVVSAYSDILPNPAANTYLPTVTLYTIILETIHSEIPEIDISHIMDQIEDLLNKSIVVKEYQHIKDRKPVDISQLDLTRLQQRFAMEQKHTTAEKLRNNIEQRLARMIQLNKQRVDFQQRFETIVAAYNLGTINVEEYFNQLIEFTQQLDTEEKRHITEELEEEELTVFDLLTKPDMKLKKKERQQVKKAAKELLETLKEQKLVLDWRKRQQTRADVKITIEKLLDAELPEKYIPEVYQEKCQIVYQHIYDSYYGEGQSIYNITG
jgi:type I restriction enzyme R subunit